MQIAIFASFTPFICSACTYIIFRVLANTRTVHPCAFVVMSSGFYSNLSHLFFTMVVVRVFRYFFGRKLIHSNGKSWAIMPSNEQDLVEMFGCICNQIECLCVSNSNVQFGIWLMYESEKKNVDQKMEWNEANKKVIKWAITVVCLGTSFNGGKQWHLANEKGYGCFFFSFV